MVAKNMRNRRSKRYEREDGDLLHVRKADQHGLGAPLTKRERILLAFQYLGGL
jgi:hypothetical protein